MDQSTRGRLYISKEKSEAVGALEVCALTLIRVADSRFAFVLALTTAFWLGLIDPVGIKDAAIELVSSEATDAQIKQK